MKAITLKQYTLPDRASVYLDRRTYGVFFYSGINASFTSKEETLAFLAKVSRIFTGHLLALTDIHHELVKEFWQIWFYLDRGNTDHADLERACEYELTFTPKMFNLIIDRHQWANGNSIAFTTFLKIIESQKNVCKKLQEFRIAKQNFLEAKRIN